MDTDTNRCERYESLVRLRMTWNTATSTPSSSRPMVNQGFLDWKWPSSQVPSQALPPMMASIWKASPEYLAKARSRAERADWDSGEVDIGREGKDELQSYGAGPAVFARGKT